MEWLSISSLLQLIVGFGLLNVWIVRGRSATSFRGGDAKNLRDEFAAYGLPGFTFYLVGALKIGSAIVLIASIWITGDGSTLIVRTAAGTVAALMIGAVAMHLKVGDPAMKSLPAALMLVMSALIVALR
ncbi:MAG: DoxX family protein [Acidobacteria bacterium]|nr:DoxX family protein [Acidobacteriota bacterium]